MKSLKYSVIFLLVPLMAIAVNSDIPSNDEELSALLERHYEGQIYQQLINDHYPLIKEFYIKRELYKSWRCIIWRGEDITFKVLAHFAHSYVEQDSKEFHRMLQSADGDYILKQAEAIFNQAKDLWLWGYPKVTLIEAKILACFVESYNALRYKDTNLKEKDTAHHFALALTDYMCSQLNKI